MSRVVEIALPIDVGETIMTLVASDAIGSFKVRISLTAWEQLRMVPPYLNDDDRCDAALFELEQLCTVDRISAIDGERVMDITIADVDGVVMGFEAKPGEQRGAGAT